MCPPHRKVSNFNGNAVGTRKPKPDGIGENMSNDPSSLTESVFSSFQELQNAAEMLNSVSDELGKSIACIDDSLRKLNLGISVWVGVTGWDNTQEGGDDFWAEEIGYAKFNGKWGLCLRRREGTYRNPDDESIEVWAFNDAPRVQRLEALDKITELLQRLNDEAAKVTKRVQARLADVQVVANVLSTPRLRPRPITARNDGGAK